VSTPGCRESDRLTIKLIARYASARIAPRVKAVWAATRQWLRGDERTTFLAYLVRVDPPFAASLVREAGEAASKGGSSALAAVSVLLDVAAVAMTPDIEAVWLTALRDPDDAVAAAAAGALGQYGSARAERALWDRLAQWNARWAGRGARLDPHVVPFSGDRVETGLEGSLAYALACGPAWMADVPKLQRLASLVVSKQAQKNVFSMLASWQAPRIPLRVVRMPDLHLVTGSVAHCPIASVAAAREKMALFPRGTAFEWQGDAEDVADFVELKAFAQSRGMTAAR
jgi:hypothetical protein